MRYVSHPLQAMFLRMDPVIILMVDCFYTLCAEPVGTWSTLCFIMAQNAYLVSILEQNLCKSNENQLLSLSDSKLLHVCLEGALPNEVFLFGDICKVYGPKMSKLHVHSICSCTVVSLDCSYASGVRSVFVKISRHKTFRIYSFAHCFLLVFVSSNKHFPSSSSSSHVQD